MGLVEKIYVLEGGIYAVVTGPEGRAAFSGEDVVRTQLTSELSTARELAAAWRQALLAQGVFSELPRSDPGSVSPVALAHEDLLG